MCCGGCGGLVIVMRGTRLTEAALGDRSCLLWNRFSSGRRCASGGREGKGEGEGDAAALRIFFLKRLSLPKRIKNKKAKSEK